MSTEIDTSNLPFMVAMQGDKIVIMRPPTRPLTIDEALNLAAWLVALSDPLGERFNKMLQAVLST